MEFLKSILGEELFKQFIEKINAYNGDEANKDKMVKLANLTDGGYVSKDKYTSLETDFTGAKEQLTEAQRLIEQMKKDTGKDETLQQKIHEYESKIEVLQQENTTLKTENALKFALKDAGGVDVDYLMFKAKEKGEIKLNEKGEISGIDELVSGLKTQLPNQFESKNSNQRKILENRLPTGGDPESFTKEDILKKSYSERMKIFESNPEAYRTAMNS